MKKLLVMMMVGALVLGNCVACGSVYFKDGKIDKISIMHQNSESRFK